MICKGQTGIAANHIWELVGKKTVEGQLIDVYRCKLCGEIESRVYGFVPTPARKE